MIFGKTWFLTLVMAASAASGLTCNYTFDNGQIPAGTLFSGNETGTGARSTGGYNNSGCLVLTQPPGGGNLYSQWAITNDLTGGVPVDSFSVSFKLYMGHGSGGNGGVANSGGNGLVFHLGPTPPSQYTGSATSWGNGLDVAFRTYNSSPNSPGINIAYNPVTGTSTNNFNPGAGTLVAKNPFIGFFQTNGAADTFSEAVDVLITLGPGELANHGMLAVTCSSAAIGNVVVYTNFAIPSFTAISPGLVTFTASIGGATEDAWLDNVIISLNPTIRTDGAVFTWQPASQTVAEGVYATFTAGASGAPPVSYQWMSNGIPVPGATGTSYTTPLATLPLSGTAYSVAISNAFGGCVSTNAMLTVIHNTTSANLALYTDNLVNNFQDGSWGTHSLANTSPVHSGNYSIASGVLTTDKIGFYNGFGSFDSTPYAGLSVWLNGGSGGGQIVQVQATVGGVGQTKYTLPALSANTWQEFTIPLASLGAASKTNFGGVSFQLSSSGLLSTYYADDIQLVGGAAPGLIHLNVNAAQTVRTVDARMFGLNTASWDGSLDTPQTISLLNEMGCMALRFPGGSTADTYHWSVSSVNHFAHVATNIGAQAILTVNYGSGTAAEAAGWVRFCNVTNQYAFKYWEVGNECYGSWEVDCNTNTPYHPQDPWTYANRFADYYQQMKGADPTIKIGIVVAPGENTYSNSYSALHPAINPRTGKANIGWTPIVLATLKSLGVTPDFASDHRYPVGSSANSTSCKNSDPLILQAGSVWASEAAGLRQQLSDYFGAGGTGIELLVTEINADSGSQSKQSVSLVNALFYADSLAQLMQTEFNGSAWWDLRNSTDNGGSKDPTLYGWRLWGDLGMVNGSTCYPTFYGAKMMQYFARPGDRIVTASSDYPLLSAYAASRTTGALTLLVINKDVAATFDAQVALSGFAPAAGATLRSYGIPQDTAAQTGLGSQDIALTSFPSAGANFCYSFRYSFPPLSLTLFSFAPSASLAILPPLPQPGGQLILQVQGQPGVYVMQTSTNLSAWSPVSTNIPAGGAFTFTNLVPPNAALQFWRAVWQP